MIGKGLPIESFHPRAAFPARAHDPIVVALSEADVPGPNGQIVQLNLNNGVSIPYTLTWSHRALKPANVAGAPPLRLSAILSAEQAKEGDLVKLNALVENVSDQNQGMTVAVIGLPAGLSLREHSPPRSANKIASWELRGRELILCWRAMAPKAKLEVELDLRCTVPGTYRGPASHVHVYHNSERKFWIDPLNIRITQVD
jgi:hypothetical protein